MPKRGDKRDAWRLRSVSLGMVIQHLGFHSIAEVFPMPDTQNNVMLPLLACDVLLSAALGALRSDPQLLNEIVALIESENAGSEASAFHYLFIPTDCPALGTNNRGVGFRLRDREERLRYAHERDLALVAGHSGYEILESHQVRS